MFKNWGRLCNIFLIELSERVMEDQIYSYIIDPSPDVCFDSPNPFNKKMLHIVFCVIWNGQLLVTAFSAAIQGPSLTVKVKKGLLLFYWILVG